MTATPRILVYTPLETSTLLDHSFLTAAGYDVTLITHTQAIESWLNTFVEDALLIITNPSVDEGLNTSTELLKAYPSLPIILITEDCNETHLRQALQIGLVDLLTIPIDPAAVMLAIQRGLIRLQYWHESNRFAHILANIKDGVILTDLTGHILTINPSAREIFSMKDEQIIGKTVYEVLNHPDLLDMLSSQSEAAQRSEISLEDGRVYSAQASLIPNLGIAVTLQEITHLKELDRIKTDFVNTVSHDLRSPLTAIYGFVGLIDRVGPINEQQAEFIHHIQSSVQHITELINDLLELGRVEAAHDIQMEDVNLVEVITRSIQGLDFQLNEKMQELSLVVPGEVPLILGNPTHLQRMICNLVENSSKFTPPMGKISVRCRAETNQLILEVEDNGHGIPLDDQPFVFDKFFRGTNLSVNTPGTGLGLSIVKTIVEKHHGRIWLESSPAGTTFTVILPVK